MNRIHISLIVRDRVCSPAVPVGRATREFVQACLNQKGFRW